MIIMTGVLALALLAIVVGMSERRAMDEAWRRIAAERRELADRAEDLSLYEASLREESGELDRWEGQLNRAATGSCPTCSLRDQRGQVDPA